MFEHFALNWTAFFYPIPFVVLGGLGGLVNTAFWHASDYNSTIRRLTQWDPIKQAMCARDIPARIFFFA